MTDLREALRGAVVDEPPDGRDPGEIVRQGTRRVRRRHATVLGAAAVAVVLVSTAVLLPDRNRRPDPLPAEVVHLDLDQADRLDLDVLDSRRTVWHEPMDDISYDRFEGLTSDGLVLRSRYTYPGDVHELGLLDPATGRTDWLPPPPGDVGEPDVVQLTADRLVLFDNRHIHRGAVLVLDRASRTWSRGVVRLPAGLEVHVPFRLQLLPDNRLYLGSTREGEGGPLRWWSFPVPEGGDPRPEPDLEGASVAWGDGVRVTAFQDGRVVLSTGAGDRLVADEPPVGCERLADLPVMVGLAGTRPVVTSWCGDERAQTVTVAYDVEGRTAVQIAGAGFLAADGNLVLLAGGTDGSRGGTYVLDLDSLTLSRVGPAAAEEQVALEAGLVLWNTVGPGDDRDTYDRVWKVARVP